MYPSYWRSGVLMRAGEQSPSCPWHFVGSILDIFWCHCAPRHLATWISGAYSCEGQFSASCQGEGMLPIFTLQIPSCWQSCRRVPSSASCPRSLGLLHGWAGLLAGARQFPVWPETSCTFGDKCSGFIYLYYAHFLILADLLECCGGRRNQKTLIVRAA